LRIAAVSAVTLLLSACNPIVLPGGGDLVLVEVLVP
jgi:hypothetical protein